MKHKNGFTLLEVLFVLGIWSIIILLSAPLNVTILEKQQEKQFLQTFQSDLLYIQSQSYSTQEYLLIDIVGTDESYSIYQGKKLLIKRSIPTDWFINFKSLESISFDENGRIREPGSIDIKTKDTTYRMVFPLGKGRGYIVEQ